MQKRCSPLATHLIRGFLQARMVALLRLIVTNSKTFAGFIIVVMALATVALSAESPKPKVEVVDHSSDPVGERLVYNIKEKIRSSLSLDLTSDQKSSHLRLIITTTDKEPNAKGNATIFSVVWVVIFKDDPLPRFLDSTIGYCGTTRIAESAENVLASTDKLISSMTVME